MVFVRPLDPSKLKVFGPLTREVQSAWPKLERYLGPKLAKDLTVDAEHTPTLVPADIAYWYDAAMLYANCLDRILSQLHGDADEAVHMASRNAESVMAIMASKAVEPFTGATGYVIMDESGNREPDYTLSQFWGRELVTVIKMNSKTQKFDIINFTQVVN
jgi:hypothetical protein